MKSCPTCQRQYDDEAMKFCLDDGSLLLSQPGITGRSSDAEPTWLFSGQSTEPPPTLLSPPESQLRAQPNTSPTAAEFSATSDRRRTGARLWIVLALIIGGSAIAIALIVTRGRQQDRTSTSESATATSSPSQNASTTEASPPVESGKSVTEGQSSQTTRETEKPTPLSRATPAAKVTPAKTDVKEEPSPPSKPATHAPISGGVLNGKAVHLVIPPYPAIAKSAHASGTVTVQVLIDEDGNVISAHAVSGHPLLQSSAVAAARASKFSPTKLSGQPVKVSGVIIYNFQAQ